MKTNSKNHELKLIKLQNQTLMKTLDYQLELIELKKAEIEDLKLQKWKIKSQKWNPDTLYGMA